MRVLGGKQWLLVGLGMLVALAAVAPSVYFYRKYQEAARKLTTAAPAEDVASIVAKVSRHIMLPQGETPTVLTVTEKERLSNQEFFKYAKNGDQLLVYATAKKAFLYDPISDKIVEVGPVTVNTTPTPAATTAPQPVRFVLLNGTTTVGLTKKFESILKEKVAGAVVVDRDNAKRQDYEKSLLIDLGSHPAAAEIAQKLNLELTSLPAGEATPAADFLIILGADKK